MCKAFGRFVVALLLSVTALGAAGCLGSFKLTTGMWDWNKKATDDKWLNELIFLGMVIIPVYEIGLLVDAIVLNSIEFWKGEESVSTVSSEVGAAETTEPSVGAMPLR